MGLGRHALRGPAHVLTKPTAWGFVRRRRGLGGAVVLDPPRVALPTILRMRDATGAP